MPIASADERRYATACRAWLDDPPHREPIVRFHRLLFQLSCRLSACLFVCCLILSAPTPAHAQTLLITPSDATLYVLPGATRSVTASITNLTGADLMASELFLNFSGYPDGVLLPRQTLGLIDFLIADRTRIDGVELFVLDAASDAVVGTQWQLDLFAVTAFGEFSNAYSYAVTIGIPEPSMALMLGAGLLALSLGRAWWQAPAARRRRWRLPRLPALSAHRLHTAGG